MAALSRWIVRLGAGLLIATAASARDEPLLSRLDLSNSGAPVEVSADRLEFAYEERVLTYHGNVMVKQAGIELRADNLFITLQGSDDLSLRSVVAEGNVVLIQGQRRASGARAVFDDAKQTVILSGGALLEEGPNQVSGDSIVIDLGLERSVVQGGTGRVQAILYPPTKRAGEGTPTPTAGSGGADE
jgi:lipopolysaccharide export system protein LptA